MNTTVTHTHTHTEAANTPRHAAITVSLQSRQSHRRERNQLVTWQPRDWKVGLPAVLRTGLLIVARE